MPSSTTRLTLTKPINGDRTSEFRIAIGANADALDNAVIYGSGTSTPSTALAGKFFQRTDAGALLFDTGSAVVPVAGLTGGASVIATAEARTNTAYGLLTTPDRVQSVIVPTNAVLEIAYQAQWKESITGAARAAVFIGSNQLKIAKNIAAGPVTQAALINGNAVYVNLATSGFGLVSNAGDVSDVAAPATTGQVIGVAPIHGVGLAYELDGSSITLPTDMPVGGACRVAVSAGTYDISVQFKASSGSVTAKNRNLWVRVLPF